MQEPKQQLAALPVKQLFIIGFCVIFLIKLLLAYSLDLYSDEIFYWQAASRPALAYSDLPFMTALLIGLGSGLQFILGIDPALAARLLFLLSGSCLPLLVYWIARPISDQQQALESAALTLCLPLAGFLGLLAVPDVPLLCLGILALGCFERALRTNAIRYWIFTGVFVALGLSTHYRFFLYPLAALLFLGSFRPARAQWRNPLLWVAMATGSIGLIPILWFNLNNELSSAQFYFVDRHPWTFQASGLLHVFKQAGLVTPFLYAVFLYTLWILFKRARSGNFTAALFIYFSLSHLIAYLILAPWTDATSTSIHWPLSGYIPLLVFAPMTLRECYRLVAQRWHSGAARKLVMSVPALGFCGTLIGLIGIGSQAMQHQLQPILGTDVLSNKMAGWDEFAQHTRDVINTHFSAMSPLIVADNYYTAAQAEFAGLTTQGYTLDQDKAVRDGRIAQLQLWQLDAAGLSKLANQELLFITEDSTLTVPAKHIIMDRFCHLVEQVEYLGELSLYAGAKRFSYYSALLNNREAGEAGSRYAPCPYPAQAWLDAPKASDTLRGIVEIAGWAFNEDIGIAEIFLHLDNKRIAQLNYGNQRPDVVQVMQVQSDPQAPALGIDFLLDTNTLPNGRHWLRLEIINNAGMVTFYGDRMVTVAN